MTRQRDDGYTFRVAEPSKADAFYELMMRVWRGLDNKDIFSVDDLGPDWVRERTGPKGFGISAIAPSGELAGIMIVCLPGADEENLGYDIGLAGDDLMRVALMDVAAVLPEHRGHGLEYRMFLFAEEQLAGTAYRWLMTTISPDNPASLRSAVKAGYTILTTKEKYGGCLRHILCKPVNGASLAELPPIPKATE